MIALCNLYTIKLKIMQKTKSHTLIVRGLTKAQKDSLKRQAAKKNQSVNGFVLSTVNDITVLDIEASKKEKSSK
jgi:hypothetical protein